MPRVWTIGHSTRSAEEFNQILTGASDRSTWSMSEVSLVPAAILISISAELRVNLKHAGIDYSHIPGARWTASAIPIEEHCLEERSFRAYADHMETRSLKRESRLCLNLADRTADGSDVCGSALVALSSKPDR